jgi:hypothetical protein
MFVFLACLVCLLLLVNRLAEEVARVLGDTTFVAESRLCGWAVILLMVMPLMLYIAYAVQASARYSTHLYTEVAGLTREVPRWVHALFLLPFTLTMAISWKAQERSQARLREGISVAASRRPPEETP